MKYFKTVNTKEWRKWGTEEQKRINEINRKQQNGRPKYSQMNNYIKAN